LREPISSRGATDRTRGSAWWLETLSYARDFDEWNKKKKILHVRDKEVLFHEREVWWCSLGVNVGYEQDGTNDLFERPVLVVKKFNRDVLWVLPLTGTDKKSPYYVPVTIGDKNSVVILSQLRLISAKRLQRYMHKLPKGQFKHIVEIVQEFFPRF
jgi:mRNA interferase MazF